MSNGDMIFGRKLKLKNLGSKSPLYGRMAKQANAADLKSVGEILPGSIPGTPTIE